MFLVGELVLCIKCNYRPELIGTVWKIIRIFEAGSVLTYVCYPYESNSPNHTCAFWAEEVIKPSELIMELL